SDPVRHKLDRRYWAISPAKPKGQHIGTDSIQAPPNGYNTGMKLPRYSLRTLFVLVLVGAIGCWLYWIAWAWWPILRLQTQSVEEVKLINIGMDLDTSRNPLGIGKYHCCGDTVLSMPLGIGNTARMM